MKARRDCLGPPRSIFVLKPSSFGDIIHTLPAVARLKDQWPESRLSWLVNPEWAPLLYDNPMVDEVVLFPRKQLRGWRGMVRLPWWLREQITARRPDLTLDYQGLLRTALIGRCAGSGRFVGLADAREGAGWFYDESVPTPPGVPHAVERYLALSDAVTGETGAGPFREASPGNLRFPLPKAEPFPGSAILESPYVLLHPFSRGATKSLSISQVQALCAGLSPVQVVVVGGGPEAGLTLPGNSRNLLNQTTLRQLLGLLQGARFVISVDSGPAHLAAALNKPMVAIHTWSDPRRVGPYLPDAWVLKSGELLQVRDLRQRPEAFFAQPPREILPVGQLEAICQLATSP